MTETPGSYPGNPEERPLSNAELKALVESNARAIAANSQQMAADHAETDRKINNLANVVQAFIAKLDSEGLRVTLITDVADDMAGEVAELERNTQRHDVSIEALRADAIADREAFREEMAAARAKADEGREDWQNRADADRQAFREEMAAARAKADEDRQAFSDRIEAANAKADERYSQQLAEIKALGEQNRALLSALANTSSNLESLDNRVNDLEAS